MNIPNVNVRGGGGDVRAGGGFSDRDLMQILLDEHKYAVSGLAKAALESSNPELRRQILNSMDTDLKHQKEIWDLMNKKGWYQPMMAQPEEVSRVQNFVSTMQQHAY